MTFEIEWTPPEADLGPVVLYAAGKAANGDARNSGDRIYTTSVRLTPAVAVRKPVIRAERGVVNAAHPDAGISPGTWIVIEGTNLATTQRSWTLEEIGGLRLPSSIDNVAVTVNGEPASVQLRVRSGSSR